MIPTLDYSTPLTIRDKARRLNASAAFAYHYSAKQDELATSTRGSAAAWTKLIVTGRK